MIARLTLLSEKGKQKTFINLGENNLAP